MKKLTIFISPVTFKSYFDVALNKWNVGQGSVFCVWLFSCNELMSLAVRKRFSETKCSLSISIERPTYLSTSMSARRITFSIFLLILEKYNVMILLPKSKFMQKFTFAITVECLHSSLQAKLLMHNCARVKHAKTCFVAYKGF